jgi:hypothetical protein
MNGCISSGHLDCPYAVQMNHVMLYHERGVSHLMHAHISHSSIISRVHKACTIGSFSIISLPWHGIMTNNGNQCIGVHWYKMGSVCAWVSDEYVRSAVGALCIIDH